MIVVTGASGMLGTQLIEALSQNFPHTDIIGLYGSRMPEKKHAQVSYLSCDLKDSQAIEDIIPQGADVYHCAAIVAFDKKSHQTLIQDNVLMTENVVNACLVNQVRKLVHVSSIASLSREKNTTDINRPIDETAQWTNSDSNSVYSKSKYFAELEVWRAIEEGLNAVIINPGIIFGETIFWDKGSNAIIDKIAKGLKYYTSGSNGYVDVKDVVDIMMTLMNSDITAERFIVVEGNYGYQELFHKIAEGLDIKGPTTLANPTIARLLVKIESLRSFFTNNPPLITKETARTAYQHNHYNNEKLLKFLPTFQYRNFDESIRRITASYKKMSK